MIVINQETCIGCGLCVKDCPAGKLKLEAGKAVYAPDCIHCGHCVAICPQKAVSIPEYDMEDVEEYDSGNFSVSPANFLHAVKFRRSIRDFKEEKLDWELLERILQAGRYTPTAKNSQSCQFVVIQDRLEELKELVWNELPAMAEQIKKTLPQYSMLFRFFSRRHRDNPKDDALFFCAPACLVIASDSVLDGGLAAANIENMAVAEGAEVLYDGYLTRIMESCPAVKEWLGIPERKIACCLLLGYPAVTYRRTAPRKPLQVIWR